MDEYKKHHTNPYYLKLLYSSMVIIHNLLVRNNITYLSCGGTLIGALRHKGIIPHDNDIDLYISDKDVCFLMSKDFKEQLYDVGYYIKYHKESDEKYDWLKILSYKKIDGVKADIDLFPVILKEDDSGKMRTYFKSPYVQKIWPKEYMYLNEILPIKEEKFGKGFIFVPNKGEKILNRSVGKKWKTTIYITQDKDHNELEKPIKIISKNFTPGGYLPSAKKQIHISKKSPLRTLIGYGFL